MGFFKAVESFGGEWILGLVRVNEQGLLAVLHFYVGIGDTRLEIEDGVGVETKCGEYAIDLGIL